MFRLLLSGIIITSLAIFPKECAYSKASSTSTGYAPPTDTARPEYSCHQYLGCVHLHQMQNQGGTGSGSNGI